MAVLGSHIGVHPRWGIRATGNKIIQIVSLPQQGIGDSAGWIIQRGRHPQWGPTLRLQIGSNHQWG